MPTKVVILDEKKEDREIILKGFASYDCECIEAENGEKLMGIIEKEKPGLIIMDPVMQDGKGFDLLQTLNAGAPARRIPVMVLTSEAKKEKVSLAAKMGVKSYLLKPIKPAQLTERASQIVEISKKTKSVEDAAQILVVDDKPLIIEQIKSVAKGTPWEIISVEDAAHAMENIATQIPDVILVSLSLPEDEGFNLFRSVRFSERTKHIPVFGMCVKIAMEEQARAQQAGMTGIITKPIDVDDLRLRLTRAMNLDTSLRYFAIKDNVLFVTFLANADAMLNEIGLHIKSQTQAIVNAGMNRLLIDLSQLSTMDTNVIRLLIQIIGYCDELGMRYVVVGSSQTTAKAKLFEETKSMKIFESVDEALKTLTADSQAGEKKEGEKPAEEKPKGKTP